jgi:hypothetical protein
VTQRGGVDVTPATLQSWLTDWPWILILDGLDEVASTHARDQLMAAIGDLLVDAADADLLIVATTRPQGYTGEFDTEVYEHLVLEDLSASEAVGYARGLVEARHPDDVDHQRQLLERLERAAHEPLTARLMRTPLQVTIMTSLLEVRPRPPRDRYRLFEAYYETIYLREAGKPGFLAQVLADHRQDVDALHDRVGLHLQVAAEGEGEADAGLPAHQLRQMALTRLADEGYDAADAEQLARRLL